MVLKSKGKHISKPKHHTVVRSSMEDYCFAPKSRIRQTSFLEAVHARGYRSPNPPFSEALFRTMYAGFLFPFLTDTSPDPCVWS